MSSSASNKVYDTLIKLQDKLAHLNGIITPEAVDKLKDKLGGIFTMAKTHHHTQGQKYGCLASVIPKSKYRLVIGNATWTHMVPTDPGAFSADALSAGNGAATCKQFVAQQKIKQKSYRDYLNLKEAGKELILYAIGDDTVAPLKKQYIGFGNTTVLAMINHLRLKIAIRMTTMQNYEYKTNGYNTPWDPTTSIRAYFSLCDCFQVLLSNRRIVMRNEEKTMAAEAQMWQSEMFTEDQMVIWENRGTMVQTWAALQTYFTEKWLEQNQYLATTAKQSQFKEAALLAQETAAAKEEGETQAMLFAMLQDQHAKQITQMEATNKTNMDAMMERVNALMAAGGVQQAHQPDKENNLLGRNVIPLGGGDQVRKPRWEKALCPNCECFVLHKLASYYELEANKASCYPGWKSIFAMPATA
jgi:hypothetical protein